MSAFGAVADWQLAASAVVTGNGKEWGGSRPSAHGLSHFRAERLKLGGKRTAPEPTDLATMYLANDQPESGALADRPSRSEPPLKA